MFSMKPEIISTDPSTLNIFSYSFSYLLHIIGGINVFFENVCYFRVFKFYRLTTNNTIKNVLAIEKVLVLFRHLPHIF